MNKRSTPSSKLGQWLGYSGMATAFLAVHTKADAQVAYTNVDPDTVLTADESYDIDFDADGVVDMTIVHLSSASATNSVFSSQQVELTMAVGQVIGQATSSSALYPSALASGAPIAPGNPDLQHVSSNGALLASHFTYNGSSIDFGAWPGQSGFLGCSFLAGDGVLHYGWVQLSVSTNSDTVTVRSFGYETVAATAINAGEGIPVGIAEAQARILNMQVTPNPTSDNAMVHFANTGSGHMKITVLNSVGKVFLTEQLGNADSYALNLAGYAPGVYFVRLQDDKKVAFRKVVKQ